MKRAVIYFAVFLVSFLAAQRILAAPQQSKGTSTLSGVVIGPNDKPAPHASVSYQSSDGSAPHAVYADAHGRFTISQLKADSYDIRASAKGIFSDWQRNIPLRKGQARSVELHLIYAKEMPKPVSSTKPKQ
ncbi:MAG TPA: carboxypeptidase-like regulatory domain-containing protein [Candidatus Acidoferrum sp.]